MKLIITLKSGKQIKAKVITFKARKNSQHELTGIEWTESVGASSALEYVCVSDIASIQTKR